MDSVLRRSSHSTYWHLGSSAGTTVRSAMNACELIQQSIGELFTCSQVNEYTRVRTPFLYPDGDVIDLFVKSSGGVTTLTDLGESLRWLRMQSIAPRRSTKQQRLVQD